MSKGASLGEDVAYLARVWESIRHGIATAKVGSRIYEDLSLPLKAVRDKTAAARR